MLFPQVVLINVLTNSIWKSYKRTQKGSFTCIKYYFSKLKMSFYCQTLMHVLSPRPSQVINNRSFQHSHFPESSDSPLWYSRETSVFQVLKNLGHRWVMLRFSNPADDKSLPSAWTSTSNPDSLVVHPSKIFGYLSLLSHPSCPNTLRLHSLMLPILL